MTFVWAALIIAWLAIALLALGFAGLMRQMAELRRSGSRPDGPASADLRELALPTTGDLAALRRPGGGIVVFTAPGCASCAEALADLHSVGVTDVVVVSSGSVPPLPDGWTMAPEARDLMARLSVPATPYLMAVGPDGTILDTLLPESSEELRRWLTVDRLAGRTVPGQKGAQ